MLALCRQIRIEDKTANIKLSGQLENCQNIKNGNKANEMMAASEEILKTLAKSNHMAITNTPL